MNKTVKVPQSEMTASSGTQKPDRQRPKSKKKTADYPCTACGSFSDGVCRSFGTGCMRWRRWFNQEWQNIRIAGQMVKSGNKSSK